MSKENNFKNSSKQKYKFNQIQPIKLQSKRKLQKTDDNTNDKKETPILDVNEMFKYEEADTTDSSVIKKASPNESSILIYGQANKPSRASIKRNPKIQQTSSINSPTALNKVQNNSNLSNISSFNGSPLRIVPCQNTFMNNDFLEIDSIGKSEKPGDSPSQSGQRQLRVSRSLSAMSRPSPQKANEEERLTDDTSHLINAMFEKIPHLADQEIHEDDEHDVDIENKNNEKKLKQLAFIKQMKEDFGSDFLDSTNDSTEMTEIKVVEEEKEECGGIL
ncbi:unnamed protein product [Hanseniaspora opuntiae]